MKGLRGKFRRSLAGFLAFCVTATSFNMVSWADVGNAFESGNATFIMTGEEIKESAQMAVDEGEALQFEDLGITSKESIAKEYQDLFKESSVYEFMPSYNMDEEECADGAGLRMFIRIQNEKEGYQLTGEEQVMFLYINDSEETIKFRSNIDGYLTEKVSVKGNTSLLEKETGGLVPGGGTAGGAGGSGNGGGTVLPENPDGNLPVPETLPAETIPDATTAPEEETQAPEETTAAETEEQESSDTTQAPDTETQAPETQAPEAPAEQPDSSVTTDQGAQAPEDNSENVSDDSNVGSDSNEPQDSDSNTPAEEPVSVSISRHVTHVLTTAAGDAVKAEEAPKAEEAVSDQNDQKPDEKEAADVPADTSDDKSTAAGTDQGNKTEEGTDSAVTAPVEDETATETKPVTDETAAETKPVTDETAAETKPVTDETAAETKPAAESKPGTDETGAETEPAESETGEATGGSKAPSGGTGGASSAPGSSDGVKGDKPETEDENLIKGTIEGKEFGSVVLDESYYAKGFVVTLKDLTSAEVEGLKLTVTHHAFYNDEDVPVVEVIGGFEAGVEVQAADYAWHKENLEYLGSSQDAVVIGDQEENKVDLYYEEIAPEKVEDEVTIIPKSESRSKARSAFSLNEDNTTPGKVFPTKTAQWVDESKGIARIDFTISGNPIRQGSDVILVIDSSGSMKGSKWTSAVSAAKGFISNLYSAKDGVASDNRLAIVDFDSSAARYPAGDSESFLKVDDKVTIGGWWSDTIYNASDYFTDYVLGKMKAEDGTNYDVAFEKAQDIIDSRKDASRPVYIVFMSDGEPRNNANSPWHPGTEQAADLRDQGVTIFSLGLNIEDKVYTKYIEPLATKPASTYAKNIKSTNDLGPIYNSIASSIKIAGTDAVITDVINTDAFELAMDYNNGQWYETSKETVSKSKDNSTITWSFGNISEQPETLTIYIKVKSTVAGGTAPKTNKAADVTYDDPGNTSKKITIPSPSLAVGDAGTIAINYYLVNEAGVTINPADGKEIDFSRRTELGTEQYGDAPQKFGTYKITAPGVIEYQGNKYQYVAASSGKNGSASPASVTLNAQNKSVNLYFGYQLVSDVTVTFNGNGGTSSMDTVTVPRDTALGNQLPTAERGDYIFIGWNTAADGTGKTFDGTTPVTENMEVYAQWEKMLELNIKAEYSERTYNGTEQTVDMAAYRAEGLAAGNTLSGIMATGSGKDIGEYQVTIIGTPKILDRSGKDVTDRYRITMESGALIILPKAVRITVDHSSKYFGQKDPVFTGKVEGLISENDLGTVSYMRSNQDEAVNMYPDVLVPVFVDNFNYAITVTYGSFEIKTAAMPGAALSADGGEWTYDGNAHAVTSTLSKADGYTVYYQVQGGQWTTTAPSVTNVAEGTVTVSVKATKTGYVDLTADDVTIKVKPAQASIQVNNNKKFFDAADPKFTGKVSGLVKDTDLGTITYKRTNADEGVGVYEGVLEADFTSNSNYIVSVKPGKFEILPAKDPDANLKIKGGSWTYDGEKHSVKLDAVDKVLAALQRYTIEYSIDGGNTWSEGVPTVTNTAEGTLNVVARGTRNGYETLISNEVTIAVTPKAVTIAVADSSKDFETTDPDFTGKAEGLVKAADLGIIRYFRSNQAEAVGMYEDVLDAEYTENGNYTVTVTKGDFTIRTATLNGAKLEAAGGQWPYDGTAHAATAALTNAEGYTIYYKTGNGVWTTDAPSVTNVSQGAVTVSVKAERTGYQVLTAEDVTIQITPKKANITINNASKFFGEQDPVFTGAAEGLVQNQDLGTISYVRTNLDEEVGTYADVLDVRYTSNGNYEVTVTKGAFEIKIAALEGAALEAAGGEWTYDGNSHEAAASLQSAPDYSIYYKVGNGEWTATAPSVTNVAEGTVTVSVKAVRHGYEDLTAEDITLKVNPKTASITVADAWKYFDGEDPEFTGTPDGLVKASDLGTISYSRTNEKEDVAVYEDVLDAVYSKNDNYTVTVNKGNFEIKTATLPGATIDAAGGSWTYDGTAHAATAALQQAPGYTLYYKTGDGQWTTTVPSVQNVSEGTVTVSVKAVRTGYEEIKADDVTLQINRKDASITAADAWKYYDAKDPVFTGTVEGLVHEKDLGAVKFVRSNQDEEVNIYPNVILPAYVDNGNYRITVKKASFEIRTAKLEKASLNGTGGEWTYNGTAHAADAQLKNAPDYTVYYKIDGGEWTTNVPSVTNVAEGTITVSVKATRKGYEDLNAADVTIKVIPATAKIKADNAEKYFDEADPAFSGKVSGLVNPADLGTVSYDRTNDDEGVGTYADVIRAVYTSNTNYTVEETPGTFKILTAKDSEADLKIKGGSWTYDGAAHGVKLDVVDQVLAALQRYTIEYSVDGGNTWSEDAPSVTNTAEGTVSVIARGTRIGYETLISDEVTIAVTPKAVSITVTDASKDFDAEDPQFTGKAEGLVKAEDLGTISYSRTNQAEEVGTYEDVLDAAYTENGNYTVTVNKGDFTIRTAALKDAKVEGAGGEWPYDGTAHAAGAALTEADGYTVYYRTGNGDWTIDAPSVTEVSEGTVTVSVKAERTGYEVLTAEDVTIKITPKKVGITVAGASKFYDESDPAFTGTVEGLVQDQDLGTISYVRTNQDEEVNTYAGVLDARFTGNSNYDVTVTKGDFEIQTAVLSGAAVGAAGGAWTYDAKGHSATAQLQSAPGYSIYYKAGNGDWSTTAPSVTNVSDGIVTVSVKAVRHGYADLRAEDVTLKINPKEAGITIEDAWKYFDEKDPAFAAAASGLVNADDLGTVSAVRTNDNEEVGAYEAVLDAVYRKNENYTVTVNKGNFEIKTAALAGASVNAAGGEWPYDGTAHAATASLNGADGYTIYYKTGQSDWTTEAPAVTNVSEGTVTVSVKAVRTGYVDLVADPVTIQVTPAKADITVTSAKKFFDETDPALSGTVTGLADKSDLGTIQYVRTNKDVESVGIYPQVLDALYTDNSNYDVTVHKADFTIMTAAITGAEVTAAGGAWTYDGNAHAVKAEVNGADGYTIYYKTGDGDWTTTPPSVTNVSDGTITVSVKATRTGYEDLTAEDVTIQITAKAVTISVDSKAKTYGFSDPEFTGQTDGLVSDQDLGNIRFHRAEGDENRENVNDDINLTAGYEANSNYEVTVKPGKLLIVAAGDNAVTVTGQTVSYDGTSYGLKAAEALKTGSTILYSTDQVNYSTEVPVFTEAGIYSVYVKATNPNYQESKVEEGIVTIKKLAITITADSAEKRYDGSSLAANTAKITDGALANGQSLTSVTVTGTQQAVGSSDNIASDAVIMSGDKDVTANYEITYVSGRLTITYVNSGGGDSGGNSGGTNPGTDRPFVPGGPGDNTVTINPENVPLASLPTSNNVENSLIIIDDGNVPLAGLPKTGDKAAAQGLAAVVSGIILAAYLVLSGKKKEEQQ